MDQQRGLAEEHDLLMTGSRFGNGVDFVLSDNPKLGSLNNISK